MNNFNLFCDEKAVYDYIHKVYNWKPKHVEKYVYSFRKQYTVGSSTVIMNYWDFQTQDVSAAPASNLKKPFFLGVLDLKLANEFGRAPVAGLTMLFKVQQIIDISVSGVSGLTKPLLIISNVAPVISTPIEQQEVRDFSRYEHDNNVAGSYMDFTIATDATGICDFEVYITFEGFRIWLA